MALSRALVPAALVGSLAVAPAAHAKFVFR